LDISESIFTNYHTLAEDDLKTARTFYRRCKPEVIEISLQIVKVMQIRKSILKFGGISLQFRKIIEMIAASLCCMCGFLIFGAPERNGLYWM
jgi:hypothetical protein